MEAVRDSKAARPTRMIVLRYAASIDRCCPDQGLGMDDASLSSGRREGGVDHEH